MFDIEQLISFLHRSRSCTSFILETRELLVFSMGVGGYISTKYISTKTQDPDISVHHLVVKLEPIDLSSSIQVRFVNFQKDAPS